MKERKTQTLTVIQEVVSYEATSFLLYIFTSAVFGHDMRVKTCPFLHRAKEAAIKDSLLNYTVIIDYFFTSITDLPPM